jgi:hypothetical protein
MLRQFPRWYGWQSPSKRLAGSDTAPIHSPGADTVETVASAPVLAALADCCTTFWGPQPPASLRSRARPPPTYLAPPAAAAGAAYLIDLFWGFHVGLVVQARALKD